MTETKRFRNFGQVVQNWDLCAALRPAFKIAEWAADESAEKTMRERHRWFITQAFEKLSI